MEMLHHMLQYREVYTDLEIISVPSMPLEFRAGINISNKNPSNLCVHDGAQSGSMSNDIRSMKDLPLWRQHTMNQMRIFNDLKSSNVLIDEISLFSL